MEIEEVAIKQLKNLFLLTEDEEKDVRAVCMIAEQKARKALSGFNNKYLKAELSPFNSVINCNYLYWLSHELYNVHSGGADKAYYLNKVLNSVDLFYAIELPESWSCEHPLGSVMGRAKYGNHFFFYQGCTVGGNYNKGVLEYPVIGKNVTMYSNSKILGNSIIGDNTLIAANAYIKNELIPDNSIVFGQSPNLIIKQRKD
ncbi:MAG: transferase [Ruminococcus sp.]|nr:transferase [Ruminococcus sp.]